MTFKAIDFLLPQNAIGKYFKLKKTIKRHNYSAAAKRAKGAEAEVTLRGGSIAYCYDCKQKIYFGLEEGGRLPKKRIGDSGYPINIEFNLREAFVLFDIQE